MTKAEQIEHLCLMLASNVANHHSEIMGEFGYAERLRKIIHNGGFAAPGTMEEMHLAKAAVRLRAIAAECDLLRAALISNTPSQTLTHQNPFMENDYAQH